MSQGRPLERQALDDEFDRLLNAMAASGGAMGREVLAELGIAGTTGAPTSRSSSPGAGSDTATDCSNASCKPADAGRARGWPGAEEGRATARGRSPTPPTPQDGNSSESDRSEKNNRRETGGGGVAPDEEGSDQDVEEDIDLDDSTEEEDEEDSGQGTAARRSSYSQHEGRPVPRVHEREAAVPQKRKAQMRVEVGNTRRSKTTGDDGRNMQRAAGGARSKSRHDSPHAFSGPSHPGLKRRAAENGDAREARVEDRAPHARARELPAHAKARRRGAEKGGGVVAGEQLRRASKSKKTNLERKAARRTATSDGGSLPTTDLQLEAGGALSRERARQRVPTSSWFVNRPLEARSGGVDSSGVVDEDAARSSWLWKGDARKGDARTPAQSSVDERGVNDERRARAENGGGGAAAARGKVAGRGVGERAGGSARSVTIRAEESLQTLKLFDFARLKPHAAAPARERSDGLGGHASVDAAHAEPAGGARGNASRSASGGAVGGGAASGKGGSGRAGGEAVLRAGGEAVEGGGNTKDSTLAGAAGEAVLRDGPSGDGGRDGGSPGTAAGADFGQTSHELEAVEGGGNTKGSTLAGADGDVSGTAPPSLLDEGDWVPLGGGAVSSFGGDGVAEKAPLGELGVDTSRMWTDHLSALFPSLLDE